MAGFGLYPKTKFSPPAFLLFVSRLLCGSTADDLATLSCTNGNFWMVPGYSLLGTVTETHFCADKLDCVFLCAENARCYSYNLGRNSTENGTFICELSNSIEAWDPQNFHSRPGFDYFEAAMDPLIVDPCLSTPCQNGGTCIEHRYRHSCQCPLEIRVLPYVDGECSVEMDHVGALQPNSGVFLASIGYYQLNFYEAERLCEILGATLATYDQLHHAWTNGYEMCRKGWLADGTVRYPMQQVRPQCGNRTGINGDYGYLQDKRKTYDAYCCCNA